MKKFVFALLLGVSFSLMSFTDVQSKPDALVYFTGTGWEIYDDGCKATTWVYPDGTVENEEGPC
jgi:hypothetical protein